MGMGYFIRMGDKSTCGGRVISGDECYIMEGLATARHGDKVICGKDGKVYQILGGIASMTSMGRPLAGTRDSVSGCPCRSRFIPSLLSATYEPESQPLARTVAVSRPAMAEPQQFAQSAKKTSSNLFKPFTTGAKDCDREYDPLENGVFIWTETQQAGHSFVSVHENNVIHIYTYGRFGRVGFGGVTGDGILNYLIDKDALLYYREELYGKDAKVFKVDDADIKVTRQLFEDRWNMGTSLVNSDDMGDRTRRRGRVIDVYDLTGRNCTTHTVKAIRDAGSKIFETSYTPLTTQFPIEGEEDFTIPVSLQKYLVGKSKTLSSMVVAEVTYNFKTKYPNTDEMVLSESDIRGDIYQSGAGSMSDMGSSSGYSGGTVGGLLGGSYAPE